MKLVSPRHLIPVVAALAGLSTLNLSAQAPATAGPTAGAPAAGARAAGAPAGAPAAGGRAAGGRAAGPALNAAQAAAVGAMKVAPELQPAVTAAQAALNAASFAVPANRNDINQKAQALADAELKLAQARADEFQKAQALLTKITPDLVAAVTAATGRGAGAAGANYSDYTGFTSLWDGKTLKNWDGESNVWSVDHDAIHMDTTVTPGQHHIHYVGPGAIMKDFDLRVEVKLQGSANGGIHYRSRLLAPVYRQDNEAPLNGNNRDWKAAEADPIGKRFAATITNEAEATAAGLPPFGPTRWQISGYQLDMNAPTNNFTGQLYEGQGRGIVTGPGAFVMLLPNRQTVRLGTVAENTPQYIKEHKGLDGEWNQMEIIAKGNTLIHIINGHVITVTIDNDPSMAALQGIMSLQQEGNGAIWYRNIYVKSL